MNAPCGPCAQPMYGFSTQHGAPGVQLPVGASANLSPKRKPHACCLAAWARQAATVGSTIVQTDEFRRAKSEVKAVDLSSVGLEVSTQFGGGSSDVMLQLSLPSTLLAAVAAPVV